MNLVQAQAFSIRMGHAAGARVGQLLDTARLLHGFYVAEKMRYKYYRGQPVHCSQEVLRYLPTTFPKEYKTT